MPSGVKFPHLILVEASAGSGKTRALARRYVEFLLSDSDRVPHNRLSNLLAITFTKNAAREMKERILGGLKGLALGTDQDLMVEMTETLGLKPEEISARAMAMVDEVIEHYSDFQVQTIDSFTSRLAKASARELGFRPDFETATSYQGLMDYALAMMAAGIGPGRDPELTAAMDRFLELQNASSQSFAWDPQGRMRESFEAFLKLEAKEAGSLVFPDRTGRMDELLEELGRVHHEVVRFARENGLSFDGKQNLLEALKKRDVAAILGWSTFRGDCTPIVKGQQKKSQYRLVESSKDIWARTGPIVAELAAAHAAARCAAFGLPYRHFKRHLERAKTRQGITHIDDIAQSLSAHLSRTLVPEIYLRLGARLHHYLVDEFQDTDPAQWRSLVPLLEEALAGDGSAFLVGDLKQAIYMFRQADYRIMRGIKQEIETGEPGGWLPASVSGRAAVEKLGENYRCGQAIVDFTARTFREVLPGLMAEGMFQPDRTGLTGYRQAPSERNRGRGYAEVRRFARPGRGEGSEDDEGLEDGPLRNAMLEIIGDARRRGYGYRDMAVLARTNRELEQAIDWLTQAGVPATSSSGLDIRQRRLVAELLALLKWLDSPIDDLAWAGIVKSRMLLKAAEASGLKWDEAMADGLLFTAGQKKGSGYLYQECRRQDCFVPLWERFFDEPYRSAGYSPAYDLACLAVEKLAVARNFPEEAAAVIRLLEAINRTEAGGSATVADVLERAGQEEPELFGLELPEGLEAVSLMTFFKAKGMGFPIVINLFSDHRPQGPKYYPVRRGDGIALYAIDDDCAGRTAGYPEDLDAVRREAQADLEAQELNSLYVACTRARDELYNLVIIDPPDKKGRHSRYSRLFPEEGGWGKKGEGQARHDGLPPMSPEAGFARPIGGWRPEAAWTRGRYAEARLGECLHQALSGIEYLSDAADEAIERALTKQKHLIPEEDVGRLAAKIKSFLANPEVSRWFVPAPGRSVGREVEFIGREGRLVRMDRVVSDPESVTVLEFKTGSESEAARAGHRRQVAEYLEILSQSFPGRRSAGLVCSLDGTVIEVGP